MTATAIHTATAATHAVSAAVVLYSTLPLDLSSSLSDHILLPSDLLLLRLYQSTKIAGSRRSERRVTRRAR